MNAMDRPVLVADPGAVGPMRDAMAQGAISPSEVLARTFSRIDAAEPDVQGFRLVDRDRARQDAAQCEIVAGQGAGALHGIPVAIKDVIDVAGWPTRAGSRTRDNAPACSIDAQVVARLRAAGAVLVGKAHTTEFAFFDGAPPTRNPHDLSRTPGGSSSGPAAVVAAGMVPISLGTQTAGSVSRPAAYCGIAAFKPSGLSWPGFGVVPFAPSFDTVGVFGYRVADAAVAARAIMPGFLPVPAPTNSRKSGLFILLEDPILGHAEGRSAVITGEVGRILESSGLRVEHRRSPVPFATLNDLHLLIREYELGHAHAALVEAPDGMVTPSLREAVARGLRIDASSYRAAVVALAAANHAFWTAMADASGIIFPAAPDIAPVGMATGDARFVVPFTALGGPIVSVPVGFDRGLPIGIMMSSAPGSDLALLELAEQIAPLIETPR
jgi:aspartyl-tRNA(Asn)/glutamyl-tRNA(Gln) amidotransferase subunit A